MSKKKSKRILTIRYDADQYEAIDMQSNGDSPYYYWIGKEVSNWHEISFSFPVDIEFVKEKFSEAGREYRSGVER